MSIALWVIAGLLAAAGLMKIAQPKAKLVTSGLGWTEDFSDGAVQGIGALEVLAALGLILPAVLDIATVLVPLAAVGLALLMIGAMITHARRGEQQAIGINVVLLVLAIAVAWGRFAPTPSEHHSEDATRRKLRDSCEPTH